MYSLIFHFRQRLHELPVDSFVYENCSSNVDTFTEFCSGYATLTGSKRIYTFENNSYEMIYSWELCQEQGGFMFTTLFL